MITCNHSNYMHTNKQRGCFITFLTFIILIITIMATMIIIWLVWKYYKILNNEEMLIVSIIVTIFTSLIGFLLSCYLMVNFVYYLTHCLNDINKQLNKIHIQHENN